MKLVVLYPQEQALTEDLQRLFEVACKNVNVNIEFELIPLDLKKPGESAGRLRICSNTYWESTGFLVISDQVWYKLLSDFITEKISDRSGFRHLIRLRGVKDYVYLTLKVDYNELNLNQISEFIKWLYLEVVYYEYRQNSDNIEWPWDTQT